MIIYLRENNNVQKQMYKTINFKFRKKFNIVHSHWIKKNSFDTENLRDFVSKQGLLNGNENNRVSKT